MLWREERKGYNDVLVDTWHRIEGVGKMTGRE